MFARLASLPLKADPRRVAWGLLASLSTLAAGYQWAHFQFEDEHTGAHARHAGELIAATFTRQLDDAGSALEALARLPLHAEGEATTRLLAPAIGGTGVAFGTLPPVRGGSIGADATESARNAAREKARDSGETTIAWPLTGTGTPGSEAVLLYRPIYSGTTRPATIDDRRRHLSGFVYARVPLSAITAAASTAAAGPSPARVRIYDGAHTAPTDLLLDAPIRAAAPAGALHTARLDLPLPGHRWTLEVDVPRATPARLLPLLATGGLAILAFAALIGSRGRNAPRQDLAAAGETLPTAVPAPLPVTSAEPVASAGDADAVSRFFRAVSEDIRTTLQTVALTNHLCLDQATTARQRGYLEKALAESERVIDTLGSVRHFFALDGGEITPDITDVDLRALILEVAEATETSLHAKPVQVAWAIADDVPPHIRTDRELLLKTLRQLARNAVATTLGGSITLSCSLSRWQGTDAILHFCVESSDAPREDAAYLQLIDELQQGTRIPSGLAPGPALRFVLASRQVALMGGELWTSAEHRAVHFTLPAAIAARPELPAPLAAPVNAPEADGDMWQVAGAPLGARVLLVEDNSVNRFVATEMLARMGIRVSEATNGLEALQALNKDEFDLVLMDLRMPVMGGCETARLIRTDPRHQHLPIVAVTANTSEAIQNECTRSGMNDFITKPIDPPSLSALLSRHLAQPAPEQADGRLACTGDTSPPTIQF